MEEALQYEIWKAWSYGSTGGGFIGHKEHMKDLTSALFLNTLAHSFLIFFSPTSF